MLRLYNKLTKYERAELYIRKLEIFKTSFASDEGNIGEYERSNKEFKDVINKNYEIKRLYNVARCIYGIWWNNDMQHMYSTKQSKETLNICIDISDLTNEYENKFFFQKKYDIIF